MWNAVEIIHGAIQRIDNPLVFAGLIAHDSFFTVKRVLRKLFEKEPGNQLLCLNVDLELDIVCCDGIDPLWAPEIFPKQLAGRARGFFSCIEIMLHRGRLRRIKNTTCTAEMLERNSKLCVSRWAKGGIPKRSPRHTISSECSIGHSGVSS